MIPRCAHRLLEICVAENNQWTLSTRLERDVLQVYASHLHDLARGRCAARERDLVYVQMRGER